MADDIDAEIAELKARLDDLEKRRAQAPPVSNPTPSSPEPPVPHVHAITPPQSSNVVPGLIMLFGGVLVIMLILVATSGKPPSTGSSTNTLPPTAASAEATIPEAPVEVSGWDYSASKDPMTDRLTKHACVTSEDTVQLGWPYGNVSARLCLRDSPQFGRDAYVTLLGDGQILCASYEGCTIRVRFDDTPPQAFSAGGPSDHSSNVVFIENRERFEAAVKKADRTIIQLEYYQAGNQPLTFNTKGLDWSKVPTAA